MASKLHSELMEQLDKATGPVQAVVQFRHDDAKRTVPSAEDMGALAKSVFERVAKSVGQSPIRTNVLSNLASAVVEADPDFVRTLIQQPEVISAVPNKTSESPFIPPRNKKAAT